MLMNEALKISNQPTSQDTHRFTYSQGSDSGASHSDGQEYQIQSQSGPEAAPASLSRQQESARDLLTSDICGRLCSDSSRPVGQELSMENRSPAQMSSGEQAGAWQESLSVRLAHRLMPVTAQYGSTLYSQTWKEHTTPQGGYYSGLRLRCADHPRKNVLG